MFMLAFAGACESNATRSQNTGRDVICFTRCHALHDMITHQAAHDIDIVMVGECFSDYCLESVCDLLLSQGY